MSVSSSMTRSSRRRRRARRAKAILHTTSQSRLRLDSSPGRGALGIPQTSPSRQWLPYQGSWHREAMTERLYSMPRLRFALRLREGSPSCNLSVTFGDTSPCRRGLGIPQTSPSRQWSSSLCRYSRHLPPAGGSFSYQGSWHREAMTERLYYMPRFRFASRLPGGTLP